jgi:outer membrane protein assembly factor BamB
MKQLLARTCAVLGLAALTPAFTNATDWPQWRGPTRNGISPEKGWRTTWPASGPRRLWSVQVGQGFSSVAVKNGLVYTMGNRQGQDYVSCIQAATGKLLWQHRYACAEGDYGGPRATPTVHNGNVYTLSREGQAICLDAATGRLIWRRDIAQELRAQAPGWGFAGSPLIQGGLVLYNIGAAGTALNKATGRIVWNSGAGVSGYASPVPFAAGGRTGVAIFARDAVVAIDPANGRQLWRHPWQTSYDVNAADPLFVGDTVFLSSNYGKGGALLRVAAGGPSVVWESRDMKNHFNTSVALNGGLYGNDENTLKCLDLATGRERWRMRGMGKGGLIAADNKLLVMTERGELVIAAATPARFTELARARVLDGTCWTHPVLANGLLYGRSHEGTLVCIDLRGGATKTAAVRKK